MNSCLLPFDLLSESPLTDIKGEAQDSKSTEIEKVKEVCAKWRQQPSWPEHAVSEQLKLNGVCALLDREIFRLEKEVFLSPSERKNLMQDENHREGVYRPLSQKMLQVAIGRVLEIQKACPSYDVFIHSQQVIWIFYSYLVKALIRKNCPEELKPHFKYLRLPALLSKSETNIMTYAGNLETHDHTPLTRQELLSVDGFFFNNQGGDSAISFFLSNLGMLDCEEIMDQLIIEAIRQFYPQRVLSEESVVEYRDKLRLVIEDFKQLMKQNRPYWFANLFVFCIPKDEVTTMCYASHEFGRPCRCHPDQSFEKKLNHCQARELEESDLCVQGEYECGKKHPPQFRLYLPEVQRNLNVRSFCIQWHYKELHEFKMAIQAIVEELHASAKNGLIKESSL